MLQTMLVALLVGLLGLALLVWGYKLFRILLPIWAFFAGFGIAASAVGALFGGGFLSTTLGWVVGFVMGLVLALLSYFFYAIAILILGATVGYAIGAGFMSAIGLSSWIFTVPVGLVVGLMGLLVALIGNLQKYLPIVYTSAAGATALITAILLLFGRTELQALNAQNAFGPFTGNSWLAALFWLILTVIGIGIQSRLNRSMWVEYDTYYVDAAD